MSFIFILIFNYCLASMAGKILIIKHIEIEGPGSIEEFFRDTARRLSTVSLEKGGSLPQTLDGIDAVISLGGPMNVYEEVKYPFLEAENTFIKNLLQEEIPFLGICLGAQLLAKAAGAQVNKSSIKEIGWYEIKLTETGKQDRLFADMPFELSVFEWHEDTFELPKEAILLAQGKNCKNQAFRVGRNAYGLQFHVEINPLIIHSWIKSYGIPEDIDGESMLFETVKQKEDLDRQSMLMYLNFSRIITQDAAVRIA